MGVDAHARHPAAAGEQQLQGVRATAPSASATTATHTGRTAINAVPRDGRPATIQDGFNFQGDKQRRQVVDARSPSCPRRRATGRLDLRPESPGDPDRARRRSGRVTGVIYLDGDGASSASARGSSCVACNAIETARLLLLSGLAAVPRRAGELLRPGRAQLHAPPHRVGLRAPSTSRCTCTAARRWRASSPTSRATTPTAASSAATTCSLLSLGVPFLAAFVSPGAWGREFTEIMDALRPTWPASGSSARTCRRRRTGSRSTATCTTSTACRCRTCTSTTTPTTSRCATTRGRRARRCTRPSARRGAHRTHALPVDPQHRHGADERAAGGRRRERVRPRATTCRTCSCPTAAVLPPGRPRTRRSRSSRSRSAQAEHIGGEIRAGRL